MIRAGLVGRGSQSCVKTGGRSEPWGEEESRMEKGKRGIYNTGVWTPACCFDEVAAVTGSGPVASARGSGGERQKRWPVAVAWFSWAPLPAPGSRRPPASRGAFGNRAPSFSTKKISFRLPGGQRSGVATWRVEDEDFDGVSPEAAKREPTQGG